MNVAKLEAVRRANDEMVTLWGRSTDGAATVTEEMLACLDQLTARQLEVLVLASKGLTDAEIAAHLGIGRFSACDHMKAVFKKLGVTSRIEAAVILAKCGGL